MTESDFNLKLRETPLPKMDTSIYNRSNYQSASNLLGRSNFDTFTQLYNHKTKSQIQNIQVV
jgi:hypothetical protein